MALRQLIYMSRPFGYDTAMLGSILIAARRNNRRDGLTGALVCRRDIYIQLLEGPEDAIASAYSRIRGDDRHLDMVVLSSTPVAARMFPEWDMLDDPARSWLWSPAEVADGVVEAAGSEAAVAVFARVAEELKTAASDPAPACPRALNA